MNETPNTTCPHCNRDAQVCPHCLAPLRTTDARDRRSRLINLLVAVNVLLLLILLGVGGFGAWWYSTRPLTAEATPIQVHEPTAVPGFALKTPAPSVVVPSATPQATTQSTAELLQTAPTAIPPSVNLSISNRTIEEGGASTTVTTWLTRIHESDVSVKLVFSGSAQRARDVGSTWSATGQRADYTLNTDTINIPAGNKSWTTQITATADSDFEEDETIVINIGTVTNAVRGDVSQVIVTIAQTEPPPILMLVSNPIVIREDGEQAQIAVVSSASISVDFEVDLFFKGDAMLGRDFHADGRSILISAKSQTGTPITITGMPDNTVEHEEIILIGIERIATENYAVYHCNKVDNEPDLLGDRWQPGESAVNLAGMEHSSLDVPRPACLVTDYRTIIIREARIPSQENVSRDHKIN